MTSVNRRQHERLLLPLELDAQCDLPAWASDAIASLEMSLSSTTPRFPCLYAVRALKSGTLRYAVVEGGDEDIALDRLADALRRYARSARAIGEQSSLIAVFPANEVTASLEEHRQRFWDVIAGLMERDSDPWPAHVPTSPEEHLWEFCFSGEPMFVFASSPAYVQRRSRSTGTFTIAFQPRFMFDRLFERPIQLSRAMALIRRRVQIYDGIPAHPDLGLYHESGNREWRQYVIADENKPERGRCPLTAMIRA